MKYNVKMSNVDISKADKTVKVEALSATSAMKIANTFNKGFTATKAIRLSTSDSPIQVLKKLANLHNMAVQSNQPAIAAEMKGHFHSIVEANKKQMNVVSFGIAKKEIPTLY